MRSVLHQANSVALAIDKAWAEAGKPEEFIIRVCQVEEKNFLGFVRKPAVVSIIFDPKTVSDKRRREAYPHRKYPKPGPSEVRRVYAEKMAQDVVEEPEKEKESKVRPQQEKPLKGEVGWPDEHVSEIDSYISDLTNIMRINIGYTMRVNNNVLKIEFDKPVLEAPSEERLLYSSLVYILMNFLKRNHKKQFKGWRILISSRRG